MQASGYKLRCPDCDKPLIIVEFNGVEIDYCSGCHGCWLDEEELGLILTGNIYLPNTFTLTALDRTNRRCPHCTARLQLCRLPESNVEVDACTFRHGWWLDAGELQQLVTHHGRPGVMQPLSQYLQDIFPHPNR